MKSVVMAVKENSEGLRTRRPLAVLCAALMFADI